jgi:hypothetical protein
MKYLLLFFLLANSAFGQNHPQDESKTTDSLNVSISWNEQNYKFTITDKVKATYTYTMWRVNEKHIPVDSFSQSSDVSVKVSEKLLKLLDIENLMSLPEDNSRGLDGYFVIISFSDNKTFKKLVYWSPEFMPGNENTKKINEITRQIREDFKTDSFNDAFINTLPPGEYRRGMGQLKVDRFLADDVTKTDFYKNAEQKMKAALGITNQTPHSQYPIMLIDLKEGVIADLNNYTLKDIKSFEIITKEQPERVIYGARGENGVVVVTTRNKK